MENLLQAILENLEYTGIGLALFVVCYISNMCFSLWYNTKVLNQKFEWTKIRDSAIKILAFGAGTALMCLGVTTIPIFCDFIGLQIPSQYADVFEKLATVAVFIYAACRYLFEAYGKFKKILGQDNDVSKVNQ